MSMDPHQFADLFVRFVDPRTPDSDLAELAFGLDERTAKELLVYLAAAVSAAVEENSSRLGISYDMYLRRLRRQVVADAMTADNEEDFS